MATHSRSLPPTRGFVYDQASPPPPPPHQYRPQQQQSVQYQQDEHFGGHQPAQVVVSPVQTNQSQRSGSQSTAAAQHKARQKSRTFSFQSHRSNKSSGSIGKSDLVETSAEKAAKRLHSKADPTMALSEAEPSVVAAGGMTSLSPIRNMQHKDAFGNPIADPDRSNPTRSRWERPLDTIRSFEAAIDGGYNRKSLVRPDSDSVANRNRRSGYYGSNNSGGRFPQDGGYYGSRPQAYRHDSQQDTRPTSYYDQGWSNGRRYSRVATETQSNTLRPGEEGVYPMRSHQRSYETVASTSASGMSGDPVGYQTDPTSSDNSSIERLQSPMARRQPERVNDYGRSFGQNQSFTVGVKAPNPVAYQSSGGNVMPPPVPQKGGLMRKAPPVAAAGHVQERPGTGEKRKSWFMRRFSKNG